MKRLDAVVAVVVLFTAQPGFANEKSEALDSRGAALLEQGDTDGALALFEQAVAADPALTPP